MDRRRFIELAAVSGLSAIAGRESAADAGGSVVNDVSALNPVGVHGEHRPRSADDVRRALRAWPGPVSVGGGRFSMGGQIAAPASLHFDMRAMNQLVYLDTEKRVARVQAGVTWRDLQDLIDPHDLSVKIMQSYSNFTVGGSVSVNCHGRYAGKGPLVNSVRAVQLVTAAGEVLELTRKGEFELFRAVFGSYGGLGVVTEVELDLERNVRMERDVEPVALDAYPSFFQDRVLADSAVVMHNADLSPPDFDAPRAISWVTTDKPLTIENRLTPRGLDYSFEKNAIWAITELPGGSRLRERLVEERLLGERAVVWRNREASLDVASLEPRTRVFSTYLLQEYFIPVAGFLPFVRRMAGILEAHGVKALNVSVRHSPADEVALLTWAPVEVFCFVLYYKQRTTERASRAAAIWTRELVAAAIANGGRYYLPYRLHATREQFEQAYPESSAFAALKSRVDPSRRFANLMWAKYLGAA